VLVGCEPADTDERIGLSPTVAAAVDPAVEHILAVLVEHVTEASTAGAERG
jgi:Ni,Fe-hydrogenase maturation factor